jgi:hypothetical protein
MLAKGRVSPTLSATGSLGTGTSELDKNIDAVNITLVLSKHPIMLADPLDPSNPLCSYLPTKQDVVTSKKSFADQFKDNVNKSIGFTLSIPIFNGLQTVTGS